MEQQFQVWGGGVFSKWNCYTGFPVAQAYENVTPLTVLSKLLFVLHDTKRKVFAQVTTHSYFLSLPNFWISYQQRIWVNQNLFTSCRFDIFCFHFAPRHFSLDFRNGNHVWTKAGGSGAPSCGQKTTSQDWAFFSSFSRCSTGQSPCCKTNWYVNSEFF